MPRGKKAKGAVEPQADDLLSGAPAPGSASPTNAEPNALELQLAAGGLDRPELRPDPEDDPEAGLEAQAGEGEGEPEGGDEGEPGEEEDLEAGAAGGEDLDGETSPDSDSPPESDEGDPDQHALYEQIQAADSRMQRLEALLESQNRELMFLRQGAGAPPQPGQGYPGGFQGQQPQSILTQPVPLGFQFTEDDVAVLNQGGANAAAILNRFAQFLAQATFQHTLGVSAQAYQQDKRIESTSSALTAKFNHENPDLAPYSEILQGQANEIWAQMPYATEETKFNELNIRTRERLRSLGISLPGRGKAPKRGKGGKARQAAAAAPRGRIRPAHSEMSSGGRPNGRGKMTAKEKEMMELIPR